MAEHPGGYRAREALEPMQDARFKMQTANQNSRSLRSRSRVVFDFLTRFHALLPACLLALAGAMSDLSQDIRDRSFALACASSSLRVVELRPCHHLPGARRICRDQSERVPRNNVLVTCVHRAWISTGCDSAALDQSSPIRSVGYSVPLLSARSGACLRGIAVFAFCILNLALLISE